jgi:hypothetical protein
MFRQPKFQSRDNFCYLNLKQSISLGQIGWEIPESGNVSLGRHIWFSLGLHKYITKHSLMIRRKVSDQISLSLPCSQKFASLSAYIESQWDWSPSTELFVSRVLAALVNTNLFTMLLFNDRCSTHKLLIWWVLIVSFCLRSFFTLHNLALH